MSGNNLYRLSLVLHTDSRLPDTVQNVYAIDRRPDNTNFQTLLTQRASTFAYMSNQTSDLEPELPNHVIRLPTSLAAMYSGNHMFVDAFTLPGFLSWLVSEGYEIGVFQTTQIPQTYSKEIWIRGR